MELRQLEHFVAVASEMSFSRAVQRAHVVQSALCLLYTSPSPRDLSTSRMPSSA